MHLFFCFLFFHSYGFVCQAFQNLLSRLKFHYEQTACYDSQMHKEHEPRDKHNEWPTQRERAAMPETEVGSLRTGRI